MKWETAKYFTDSFVSIGWKLDTACSFPHCNYLSADTETKLYLDGKQVDDDTVYNLYKQYGQAWIKKNLEVRAYAFTLSDGENFALFQNAEDFLTACAMFNAKRVFWYNAKFDFAIFDYYFLTNGWTETQEQIAKNKRYQKLQDKTYQSLNGDFGQRYQLRIWKSYINKRYQTKVANFKFIDICNIYGGGLAKNLNDWKIIDHHGNDVRKLEMDYVEADIEQDIQYMINDVKGLHLLAEKINETLEHISGFSLFNGDFITAGGLAKKVLLKEMFNQTKPSQNIEMFKQYFPIRPSEDKDFRDLGLYAGGKCLVNPNKIGKVQTKIYKYDVNSMYPKQMRDMKYPLGKPKRLEDEIMIDKSCLHIYKISNFAGRLKKHMIPIWQDRLTGDYKEKFYEPEIRYIWEEELDELKNWYVLTYEIEEILEYRAVSPKGAVSYINKFYDIKSNSKGVIKNGAKLFLNSAYGKLAQRIERVKCHYELSQDGYVHLVKDGVEIDDKSMLSIVVGSRITALAKVMLMIYIREICKGNVEKNFIYCDTDSVHSLTRYDDTDPKELGKMKEEGIFSYGLYLAPKTYLMYDNIVGERYGYEVHCKGVNTKVVLGEILKCKDFNEACDVFSPNRTFKCLSGLNVKGGKALIYTDKVILNDTNLQIVKALNDGLEDIDREY